MERRVAERVELEMQVHWRRLSASRASALNLNGEYSGMVSESDKDEEFYTEEFLERQAYTENLSTTGLKLVGDLRLQDGSALRKGWKLQVDIVAPGEAEPIRSIAEVVWVTPPSGPPPRQAGLLFESINKQDVERLVRLQSEAKRAKAGAESLP